MAMRSNPELKNIRVNLLCFSKTERDILLRTELLELKERGIINKFQHSLDATPKGWDGYQGFVSK